MFKIKKIHFVAIIALLTSICIKAQSELTFSDNEKLGYVGAYSLGFIYTEVADISLSLQKTAGKDEYVVKGGGLTRKFYSNFFSVNDYYETHFQTQPNIRSLSFYRSIEEGGYTMKNDYKFDWTNKMITGVMQKQKEAFQPFALAMEGNKNYSDVLTAFYNFRNQNFNNISAGKKFSFYFILDNEFYSIQCVYIGKEVRKLKKFDKKPINTLKFNFEVVAGEVFKGNEVITVWISDDANHIPLEFDFPIRVGRMRAYLSSYQNLKFPLNFVNNANDGLKK